MALAPGWTLGPVPKPSGQGAPQGWTLGPIESEEERRAREEAKRGVGTLDGQAPAPSVVDEALNTRPAEQTTERLGLDRNASADEIAANKAAGVSHEGDDWATIASKFSERLGPLFKQAGAGFVQAMAEQGVLANPEIMATLPGDEGKTPSQIVTEERAKGLVPGQKMYAAATADLEANAYNPGDSVWKNYVPQVAESIVQMLPGVAASIATRNPFIAGGVMAGQVGAQQYGESAAEGRSPTAALVDATWNGAAEAIGEEIPVGLLMKPGGKFLAKTLKTAGAEGLQEMFTQVLQTGYDKGVLHPDMPWGEALAQIRDAGIVGAAMGGTLAVGTHPIEKGIAAFSNRRAPVAPVPEPVVAPLTDDDIASPLPDTAIQAGKTAMADLLGEDPATGEKIPGASPLDHLVEQPGRPKDNLNPSIVAGLIKRGIPEIAARGAAAGVHAEAASNPNALNKSSGAMGLGQWLGPRKAELIRRYGPNPTIEQQLDFLAHELKGGDQGGAAVLGSQSDTEALHNYITKFMRPAAGAETTGDLERGMAALGRGGEALPGITPDSQGPSATAQLADELIAGIGADSETPEGMLKRVLGEDILEPKKGERVDVTQGDQTVPGTVEDVWERDGRQGVRIRQDDGTIFDEALADARQYGARITKPVTQPESRNQPDSTPANSAPLQDLQGEPTSNGFHAFPPESGHIGIARADMPQIKAEHRGAMVNFLAGRGITHTEVDGVDPAALKPAQAEFSPEKVQKAKEFEGGNRAILVSQDGYVVDGTHQWLAARDEGKPIRVIQLNAPIREVLDAAAHLPSATASTESAAPEGAPEGGARIEDTTSGKGIAIIGASAEQMAAVNRALPKAKGVPRKDGAIVYSKKYEAEIRDALGGELPSPDFAGAVNSDLTPEQVKAVAGIFDRAEARSEQVSGKTVEEQPKDSRNTADEHPGLVIRNLRTGEEQTIQPPGTVAPLENATAPEPTDFRKTWDSKEFKTALKALGEAPHRESHVASDTARGWQDGKAGNVEALEREIEDVMKGRENYRPTGFNPRQGYIEGFYAAVMPKPTQVRAIGEGADYIGALAAGARIEARLDEAPEERADREAAPEINIGETLAGGTPVAEAATAARKAEYGANNKLVTQERAAELRARLKEKLNPNRLNAGIDPELLALGTELAVFHIEAGVRKFADFAKAVAADLDTSPAALRSYLRSWYNGARDFMEDSGQPVEGMDSPDTVREALAAIAESPAPENSATVATEETADAQLSDGVPASDAGPSPADVQGTAQPAGSAGSASRREAEGSASAVRPTDEGRQDTAERGAGRPESGTERNGAGVLDADRVPAAELDPGREPGGARAAAARVSGADWTIEPGSLAENRAPAQKARDNIEAVEIVKRLTVEGRPATREEQAKIAQYVGWGGLKNIFPDLRGQYGKGFEELGPRLRNLLNDDEYETAKRSIQWAHYTGETVVRGMWEIAQHLGFKGGAVFEPGMGTGNFRGMMPADIAAASNYSGLEYDHLTADIAKALYPESGVRQGDYTRIPRMLDAVDLVIGNPPFAETAISTDKDYGKHKFLIHDFFFAKAIDAVKPGGLLMFVTSAGTMNKASQKAREFLADRANLVGAIRLPGNTFEKNAGTSVTTDIVILQKRAPGEKPGDTSWLETETVSLPDRDGGKTNGEVNRYFIEHPEMVLGEQGMFDTLVAGLRYAVRAPEGFDLSKALSEAMARLPRDVVKVGPDGTLATGFRTADVDLGSGEKKEGSYYVAPDGRLMQYRSGVGVPVQAPGKGVTGGISGAAQERIRALIPVRDALRDVYAADIRGDEAKGAKARADLNAMYDRFVGKFGPINKSEISYRPPTSIMIESARAEAREEARLAGRAWDEGSFDIEPFLQANASITETARARKAAREEAIAAGQQWDEGSFDPEDVPEQVIEKHPNLDPFMADEESYRLAAIEHFNKETGEAAKGRVFFENALKLDSEPQINSAQDALLYSLNQRGFPDLDVMADISGKSRDALLDELAGQLFPVPEQDGRYETAEIYLSGNVREKLATAEAAALRDPTMQRNVDALKAVQPRPLTPSEISANLGMPWIPPEVIGQFATERMELTSATVKYQPKLARWSARGDTTSASARSTWGTEREDALSLLEAALNRQTVKVYDKIRTPEGERRVLNAVDTQAAQDKQAEIKQAFSDWLWTDETRRDTLVDLYNREYNSLVAPSFDGSYLTTPGISSGWSWRPHQRAVVSRIIQTGNTYMAHEVGAGKTSAMIGAGMEMKRLGLVNKPMYVVPNHMLGQFTKEFYEQYPLARIKVADEQRFHTARRKSFVAQAAAEDVDAIIITHSAFGFIQMSEEFTDSMIADEIDALEDMLREIDKDERVTRRTVEQQKQALEQRLTGKRGKRSDQVFTFEEMGVDFLFTDEAHLFRKLSFATKMGNVKGIDPNGSQAAFDLYAKVRYLESRRPGRSIVLASGTPITNTMAELFSVSRYLQQAELEKRGLAHFDAWAGAFGDTVTALEQNPAGGYDTQTRFAKFVNVPELSVMVRQVMDVVGAAELRQYVSLPTLKGGERQMHVAEQTPDQESYQETLKTRIENIRKRTGPPKKGDDILLSVIGDGRKNAIDYRLVEPAADKDEGSKLELLIDNTFKNWEATKRQPFHEPLPEGKGYSEKPVDFGPATQMIFADLGINGGFPVHKYIKQSLIARGVPEKQIAIISDYKTHVAKQRLFNDMNEGKVRVLIGSVPKMGTGVNAQRRLYAIHNLDPQWYPANDIQRNGRGIRQGNMNPEIEINDYSTHGTYDSQMWALMAKKARFIEGFMRGDPELRDMEDLGEASQYEQAQAITTADPRIMDLTEWKQELEKIERRRAAHDRGQHDIRLRIAEAKSTAKRATETIPLIEADIAQREPVPENVTYEGKEYEDKAEFGERLMQQLEDALDRLERGSSEKIGTYRGFTMRAESGYAFGGERVAHLIIVRNGKRESLVKVGDSARGLVTRIDNALGKFEEELAEAHDRIAHAEKVVADYTPQLGAQFDDGGKAEELRGQITTLEKTLAEESRKPGEGVIPTEEGPRSQVEETAGWTDQRINTLMRKYAVAHAPTKTKSYVAWVSPQEFLDVTTPANMQERVRERAGELDTERLTQESQEPFLIVTDDGSGDFRTVGHEGRHRMAALAKAGIERVPVVIEERGIPWSDLEARASVFLGAQRHGGDLKGEKGFFARDLLPLTYANRDEIKAKFGQGRIRFRNEGQSWADALQGRDEEVRAALQEQLEQFGIADRITLDAARKLSLGSASGQSWRGVISIALDKASNPAATLAHETVHAMRDLGLFTPAEWRSLVTAAWENQATRRWAEKNYGNKGLSLEDIREEAAAEHFADYWRALKRPQGLWARAFTRIANFAAALARAVNGLLGRPNSTAFEARLVQEKILSGEIGDRSTGEGSTPRAAEPRTFGKRAQVAVTPATFDDAETEERWKDARTGIGADGPGILEHAGAWWEDLTNGFTRHWRALPNLPRFSDVAQQFRKLEAAPEAAKDASVRYLRDLVGKMDKEEYDLFSRKVVLDDLAWEAGAEHQLPFGFTPRTLRAERIKIDALIDGNEKLVEAVRARKAHNREIADAMVEAGVLTADQIKNPAYYRHMVLDYARHTARLARGNKQVKAPYWARRMGSTLDINANLLEAEFDWLQKAQIDVATAKTIEWLKKSDHNIRSTLREQAKETNRLRFNTAMNRDQDLADTERDLRQQMAIGYKFVQEAIESGHVDPIPPHLEGAASSLGSPGGDPPFALLSWMLDNDKPGAHGAAIVLKNAGLRKALMRNVLGEHYIDPDDIAGLVKRLKPEGYKAWQPTEGRHFFTAKTISESALDMFVGKLSETAYPGVAREELHRALTTIRPQLVVGGDRYTMVLPDEIADTLTDFGHRHAEGMVAAVFGGIQSAWKRWVLINPRRFFKYNINNMSGDLDAIIAGNPGTLGKVRRAWTELRNAAKGEASDRYREALERGVFTAGLSINEIPDINRLSAVRHLTEDRSKLNQFTIGAVASVWRALQDSTQFRENLFRMAAYLDYVEKIDSGKSQLEIGYGASVPNMVDAVEDPRDKAALLARDLVGDYGSISVAGSWLRRYLVPFWSWMEINTRRYWRLTSNAYSQSKAKGIATGGLLGAGIAARSAATLALRMGAVYGLVYLWNHLLFGDDEDKLGDLQKRQMHLILGHNSDGEVITLRTQGALSDVLGELGLPDAMAALNRWQNGQGTLGQAAIETAKAPLNRVGTSVTPIISSPIEHALGLELWPDMFQPRVMHDHLRNVASTVNLENEYDQLAGKPSRGYLRSWEESAVYKRDPGEMAYDTAKSIAYDWLENVKGQASSAGTSPRSEALRDYRLAMRYGDKDAAREALKRYVEFEGTTKGLKASIKSQHPLGPIAKKDRKAFLTSLTQEQLETFVEAEKWYNRVYLGQEAEEGK